MSTATLEEQLEHLLDTPLQCEWQRHPGFFEHGAECMHSATFALSWRCGCLTLFCDDHTRQVERAWIAAPGNMGLQCALHGTVRPAGLPRIRSL